MSPTLYEPMPVPPRDVVKVEDADQTPELTTAMPEEPEESMPVPPYVEEIAVPFHAPCTTVPSREAFVTAKLVVEALVVRSVVTVDEAILNTVAEDEAVFAMNWFDT